MPKQDSGLNGQDSNKPLRFAALIRVSTEKQEKQGESLRTQDKQIGQAVASLEGQITKKYAGQEHATKYAGQEHATSGWEREQLNALLADARKARKPFDAVIVADPSRWSRDNVANETGLDILRDNGIRFFVLTTEYDLFDPQARFFLSIASTINAFQANTQKQKSILNRIERAKRGIPTSGKMPFGRQFDKETGKWNVIPEKKAMVEDCAHRYLQGESLANLAPEYGINHTNLHKTLMQRCGTQWEESFTISDLNIEEVVPHIIPRLLPEVTIKAIRKRCQANKTYLHGKPKHDYLLSGRVFCGKCGYGMFGQTNHCKLHYYRHAHSSRCRECGIKPRPWVRADQLEATVLELLFETFGNPIAIEKAIREAQPNSKKVVEARKRIADVSIEIGKIEKARNRILNLIERDAISDEQAEQKLGELKAREAKLLDDRDKLSDSVSHLPDADAIKEQALVTANWLSQWTDGDTKVLKRKKTRLAATIRLASHYIEEMSDEDKKGLIDRVFDGSLPDSRPCGVYVFPIAGQKNHRAKRWAIEVHGLTPLDGNRCEVHSSSGSPAPGLRGRRFC